ncbi:hypothetical protein [Parasitella parasitica]|uniref:Uncharacterized protein n=1 Tax=Parasitella parasitica TaxID=35722 RepID=A0A0B7NH68_9FUNG|nr:hypothetical protein [Parasitella parasitica]
MPTDLLDNQIFSGFLLVAAGCTLALQSDVGALGTPLPSENLKGGICGFFYVASNILAVPKLGVGTSLALFVCAQVITACIVDNWGLVGVEVRPYSTWRILASLGAVFCVGVITKF